MKMINKKTGEAVYFNPIRKNGKDAWIIQGIGPTVVIGRDRQKLKSRTFAQYPQRFAYAVFFPLEKTTLHGQGGICLPSPKLTATVGPFTGRTGA